MVDVSLVLSQLSFCCTYFVFIVGNVPRILPIPAPDSMLEWVLTPDVLVALQVRLVRRCGHNNVGDIRRFHGANKI